MPDENNKWDIKKWKAGIIIVIVIAIIDILLLFFGTLGENDILGITVKLNIAFSVGGIGIVTFLGVLVLMNYLSESKSLEKGEMRKAIAASFTIVYIALLSLLTFKGISLTDSGLSQTMMDHFTTLVGVIVAFYFGSRSADEYSKAKVKKENVKVQQIKEQIELEKIELEKLKLEKLKHPQGKKNEQKDKNTP